MEVTLEPDGTLVVRIPTHAPALSKSGNTKLIASATKKDTGVKVDGKEVTVGINAYIKP